MSFVEAPTETSLHWRHTVTSLHWRHTWYSDWECGDAFVDVWSKGWIIYLQTNANQQPLCLRPFVYNQTRATAHGKWLSWPLFKWLSCGCKWLSWLLLAAAFCDRDTVDLDVIMKRFDLLLLKPVTACRAATSKAAGEMRVAQKQRFSNDAVTACAVAAYQPVSRHRSDASQPPKSHSGSVGELDSNPKSRDRMFANGAAGQAATKRSWRPSLIARLLAKSDETATDARKSQRDSPSHLSASRTKSNFVQRSHQRDMRLLRTLTIILVLLLISTVPLGVLFLVSLGETDKRYVQTTKVLLTSSLVNSFLNPWIYLWRFREIRRCINAALRRCLPCCDEALRRNMTETPASGERRRGEKKQLYFSSAKDRSTKIAEHKSGARADSSAWRDTGGTSSNSAVWAVVVTQLQAPALRNPPLPSKASPWTAGDSLEDILLRQDLEIRSKY